MAIPISQSADNYAQHILNVARGQLIPPGVSMTETELANIKKSYAIIAQGLINGGAIPGQITTEQQQ